MRIRYIKLDKNEGISGNTNAALALAGGEYIGVLDHDDVLHASALFEVMHVLCDKGADFIYTDELSFRRRLSDAFHGSFKPDFSFDYLRGINYICHFMVFSKELLYKTGGGFQSEYDGSQDHDLALRLAEQAACIVHIPKALYGWRAHPNSTAQDPKTKSYAMPAGIAAVSKHLERCGLSGIVSSINTFSLYRIQYTINESPFVSIIIPNKDNANSLRQCLHSLLKRTTYTSYEILVIENNSSEDETFAYYENLHHYPNVQLLRYEGIFNYAAINNFGAQHAKGEHLLFLNNDVTVISDRWIEEMLMFSQRGDVGAVGAKLYYPDNTIQHAGVGLGIERLAGHYHKHFPGKHSGYMSRLLCAQNVSAVTGACLMMRKDVFVQIGGFDEALAVAFNDVDLCMRVRVVGYLIVWTPFAELYHHESLSRGTEDTPKKKERFMGEVQLFQRRWAKELSAGDPYYNPNLTLDRVDFTVRDDYLVI